MPRPLLRRPDLRRDRFATGTFLLIAAFTAALLAPARGNPLLASPRIDDPDPTEDALEALRRFENERRSATDFASLPPSTRVLGPNPSRITLIQGTDYYISTLRGVDRVVVLDSRLTPLRTLPAPPYPSGIAAGGGRAIVAGGGEIRVYPLRDGLPDPPRTLAVPGAIGLGDLASDPDGTLFLHDEPRNLLLRTRLDPVSPDPSLRILQEIPLPPGPARLQRAGRFLVVDALYDHSLLAYRLGPDGAVLPDPAVIRHDGPLWCFQALQEGSGLLIAAGGVEDHPLDRTGGFFGFVDSFAYLYRVESGTGAPVRLAAVDVSELGVVTPKWIRVERPEGGPLAVTLAGYATPGLLRLTWPADLADPPRIEHLPGPPGTADAVRRPDGAWLAADPLLDAWVEVSTAGARTVPARTPVPARSRDSRLGELLFFTTLMAPANASEGPRSRFTCETCHLEGHIDGRVHYTGRDSVFASTKPLFGLFNNKPHFSRALDDDLTEMVNHEFRVANAGNGRDPWFPLDPTRFPWLADAIGEEEVPPEGLRRALMSFLMEFTHPPNPRVRGRTAWTERERRGAGIFRDRCETCHAARLIADDPSSRVPFERWERLVLSPEGPVVWASAGYRKTGIVPYVHENGARTPSLRRVSRKTPLFTDGSSPDLRSVLERARFSPWGFLHRGEHEALDRLDPGEIDALLGFLLLL